MDSPTPPRRVVCHHRPAIQPEPFRLQEMIRCGEGVYRATLPGNEISPEWDLMVFFEVLFQNTGLRWPDWRQRAPYLVIETRPA